MISVRAVAEAQEVQWVINILENILRPVVRMLLGKSIGFQTVVAVLRRTGRLDGRESRSQRPAGQPEPFPSQRLLARRLYKRLPEELERL